MAEMILLWITLVVTSFVFLTALPWLAQRFAVLWMHDARDELYKLAAKVPGARDTLVYRNTEYIITDAIRVLREGSVSEAFGLFCLILATISKREQLPGHRALEVAEEMKEVFGHGEHCEHLLLVLSKVRRMTRPLAWRLLWANPLSMLGVLALVVIYARRPRSKEPTAAAAQLDAVVERMKSRPSMGGRTGAAAA